MLRALRAVIDTLHSVDIVGLHVTWNDDYHDLQLLEVGWGGIKLLLFDGRPLVGFELVWPLVLESGWSALSPHIWLGPLRFGWTNLTKSDPNDGKA